MNIDIPFAGWILSLLTFTIGTLIPIVYRRISYEGVGIRQPYDMRAITQETHDIETALLKFCTIVKIANSQKESILLDDIKLSSPKINNIIFKAQKRVNLTPLEPDGEMHIPFSSNPKYEAIYFPLIIKADEERFVGIEIHFIYSPKNITEPWNILANHIASKGLPVKFRINGKYRDYVLQIQGDK